MSIKKKYILLISFLSLYLAHQIYFIFIGGTTWDEPASILSASKQIFKAYFFFFDNTNPIFDKLVGPEFYGGLLFIPAYLITSIDKLISLIALLLSGNSLVNHTNEIEIALIIRHIFLNLYILFILIICFFRLKKDYQFNRSFLFVFILLLIPSFNGHALFNYADIPFAMQYLLASIFFISFLNNFENKKIILLGILFGFSLLTRLNAVVFLSFLPLFEIFQNYMLKRKYGFGYFYKKLIFKFVKIYSIAILVLFVGTPSAWKNPIDWIRDAYIFQFKHPNNVPSVLNGKQIFAYEAPRTYLVEWFFYKLPFFFLVLFFVSLIMFATKKELRINNLYSFSLFNLIFVNLAFIFYSPVAYDGIRHYLFLIPFFVIFSAEPINYVLEKNKNIGALMIFIFGFYMVYSQFGLGSFKYVYLNEFVDETKISIDCEEYLAQSGCGDWHTDYWGFGGKELYKISKKYNSEITYFCPPQFTYSMFQDKNNPWELVNGDFVFDDKYPFTQDEIYYYQSHLFEYINSSSFTNIEFLALNYHRPPTDSCGLTLLDKKQFDISCTIIDGVKVRLRNSDIPINYLSECSVSRVNN